MIHSKNLPPAFAKVMQALVLVSLLGAMAAPAWADDHGRGWGRGRDRDHHWRGRDRHGWYPYPGYVAPAPVYAPPPVYAPVAPVSPGINLIVPFNFR